MTVVRLRHAEIERPVLVVEQQRGDTVIRMRTAGDEHLTLHREQDGGILLTHRSSDKPPSVWDEPRVVAARKEGYANPERHGDPPRLAHGLVSALVAYPGGLLHAYMP